MRAVAWRHAWGLIRNHPGSFFSSLGFYVAYFSLTLAPGLITRSIFDALSGHARAGLNIWTLIGLMLALELARVGALYFGGVLFNVFYYSSEAVLKRNMLAWLVSAPGPQLLPSSTGEAVSRFRDDTLEAIGLSTILIVSPQIFTGVIGFAIMLTINAPIALLVVPPVIATVVVTYLLTRGIQRYRKAAREATAEVTSFIGETFGAVQAVKLAGAEARLTSRLADLNDRRRAASIRDLMLSTGLAFFNTNVAALGTGFVLLLAANAMRAGAFTVGDFTLFANYLGLASASPLIVGQVLAIERQSRVSIRRMRALMQGSEPLALVARPAAARPAPASVDSLEVLEVRGLTRLHAGSGRGASGVDLTLKRGGFLVITGPVGGGKTTLLRSLLGLIPRDDGDILWNGAPVADPSSFMVPPRCAYTAQAPRLFSETLGENVLMGSAADEAAVASAIELAVFEDDVARFDLGLATRVGARGVTLSGGQLQRAAAARMFLRGADLLVFDDLSSALDVGTEQQLWQRLFAAGGRSCIAVSHRREALRRADEVLVLDEGRVVARGKADLLLERSALFRRIWGDTDG
jgi:ATP-binding cassette, subfamily B, bacterial